MTCNYYGGVDYYDKDNSRLSKSRSVGASGTFQVISIIEEDENGQEKDLTKMIDQGKHYGSPDEVIRDLGLDPKNLDFEME